MNRLAQHFIEAEPRRRVGDVSGVKVAVTRGWWVQPLGVLLAGQLIGRLFCQQARRVRSGLGYSATMLAVSAVHAGGHIATARMVEAPMDTLLVTPFRTFTLYDDAGAAISEDQHRGRAIGGPAANLAAGFGALLLSLFVNNRYLRFFGIASTFVGLGSLIPAGGNDGEELFLNKHD